MIELLFDGLRSASEKADEGRCTDDGVGGHTAARSLFFFAGDSCRGQPGSEAMLAEAMLFAEER